ncbi:MAG: DHH family phosphoesterase, partial [Candidatus Thermoplasmatota archaeon]|nr:DHH family phosphoesterase [Candidatus Thermoplasmatota archaeon]
HDDADGITAGAILTRALARADYFLKTKVVNRIDESVVDDLARERMGFYVFADIGSGYSRLIELLADRTGAYIIVLDHHKVVAKSNKFIQINCNDHGISGSFETSGSVMAFLFSCVLDIGNFDLLDLALAGAAGDKQKIYGFTGLNSLLAELGVKNGIFKIDTGMELYGKGIAGSLRHTFDPYFKGLSGRDQEIVEFLGKLGLSSDSVPERMNPKERTALNSALMLRLVKAEAHYGTMKNMINKRYYSTRMDIHIEEIAGIVNGCGNLEEHSLALAFCLSPGRFRESATKIASRFNERVLEKLIELEKGLEVLDAMDYFIAAEDQQAGTATGVAIRYLSDGNRPLLGVTIRDEIINISGRGTKELVEKGLDLAEALSKAAKETGGMGGGHPVASGATIPKDGLKGFMDSVNATVSQQMTG